MYNAEPAKEAYFKGDFDREWNLRKWFWGIETELSPDDEKKSEEDLKKTYNLDKHEMGVK